MDTPRFAMTVPRSRLHLLALFGLLAPALLGLPTACTTLRQGEAIALRPLQKPQMIGMPSIFERVEEYGQFADTNPVPGPIALLQGDHPIRQAATPIRGEEVPLVSNLPAEAYADDSAADEEEEALVYPVEKGVASHYSYKDGRVLATGERYSRKAYTAAHKKLPFGTVVRVTRVDTGKSVVVTINDRGPYVRGRIIDLAEAPARDLGLLSCGVTRCKLEVLAYPLIETMGPRGNG